MTFDAHSPRSAHAPLRRVGVRAALCAAALAALCTPSLAAEPPVEQIVGGIEAIVFVCAPIDPKSAKTGQELLQKTIAQHGLNLAVVRKSEGYKSIYNSEVNRMLGLSPADRAATCRNAW